MSSPNKLVITGAKVDGDRTIISTTLAPGAPCKSCKTEPRRQGSAYCQGCATIYKDQQFNADRFQRKINEKKSSNTNQEPTK